VKVSDIGGWLGVYLRRHSTCTAWQQAGVRYRSECWRAAKRMASRLSAGGAERWGRTDTKEYSRTGRAFDAIVRAGSKRWRCEQGRNWRAVIAI